MPGGFVCSGSMKNKELDPLKVKETFARQRPTSKLFTKEQRAFYSEHAPEGIELDDLSMLGPINIMKLKFTPGDFGRKMVAELWFYPNGSRILELSTKCAPSEAFDVAAEARNFLTEHGVDLAGEQQTKTKTALDFFAGQLQAAARRGLVTDEHRNSARRRLTRGAQARSAGGTADRHVLSSAAGRGGAALSDRLRRELRVGDVCARTSQCSSSVRRPSVYATSRRA